MAGRSTVPDTIELPREVQVLTATKLSAERVMANKHALVEVDRRRQAMRHASRALLDTADKQHEPRVSLLTGSVMLRLPVEEVQTVLKKDLAELDVESNRLRSQLKEDVSLLHELEMRDPMRGLDLQALSRPEMEAVGQVLGRSFR